MITYSNANSGRSSLSARLPFRGSGFKTPAPIQDASNDYRSAGDNSSPIGRVIPVGVGMFVHQGEIVVDPKHIGGYRQVGDKVLVNLVFCIKDTLLASPFELVWARANKEFIIRKQAPLRSINSPYRFYGGDQSGVDPIITRYLPEADRTAWPGYVYIVFEDFNIAPYGNKIPIFDFNVASSVTSAAMTEEQSTLTFGPVATDGAGNNFPMAVDRVKGHHYQFYFEADELHYISTIDINSNVEVNRSLITASSPYKSVDFVVALDGSDYIACTSYTEYDGSFIYELSLLNTTNGVIVARLPALWDGNDPFEPFPKAAILLESTTSTKYLIVCGFLFVGDTATQSYMAAAIVDVTNETMEWIIHPYTNPAEGESGVWSVAFGPVLEGVATVFWTEAFGGYEDIVCTATITAAGFTSRILYTESNPAKSPVGVAYNSLDNLLVVYREDGSFLKINTNGSVASTISGAITDFNINQGNYDGFQGLITLARPGYVIASRGPFYGDIYEIDLASCTAALVIDHDTLQDWDVFKYYDQYRGILTEGSEDDGQIWKVTLGDATPNQVDLEDIYRAIVLYGGRHISSDIQMSGFPGTECHGLAWESAT